MKSDRIPREKLITCDAGSKCLEDGQESRSSLIKGKFGCLQCYFGRTDSEAMELRALILVTGAEGRGREREKVRCSERGEGGGGDERDRVTARQ